MGTFGVIFLLVLAILFMAIPNKKASSKTSSALDPDRDDEPSPDVLAQLVREMFRGNPQALYGSDLRDQSVRNVQIIADSIRIIDASSNGKTRNSRLETIASAMARLNEDLWGNFSAETIADIEAEVDLCGQKVIAYNASDEAMKHLSAANRFVKPETKKRYLLKALAELEHALERMSHPECRRLLENAMAVVKAVKIDGV